MMKRITLFVLFLLLIGLISAEVYTIGNGTNTQSNVPYDGETHYGWSKMIYTATELSNAGVPAGLIAGLGFHVGNSPAITPVFNQQVYIRNTTTNVYLTNNTALPDNSAFQNVYHASYTWQGNSWNSIMFNTPFLWNGTSNIEILWENWDGFGVASYPAFSYTTTSAPMTVYNHDIYFFPADSSGTLYLDRPNIQFVTGNSTIPQPATLLAPANGSFTMLNPRLSWNAGSGLPTSYDLYFGTNPTPPFVQNQSVNFYQLSALAPATTYYWKVVPQNSLGQAVNCPTWSFSTPGPNQLIQSFETSVPPPGWVCVGSNHWSRSTVFHSDGIASAKADGNPNFQRILSTPKLNITAGSTLVFDLMCHLFTGTLEILYSPDRINWSLLQGVSTNDGNTWETKIVDLSSIPGSYYLAFRTPLNDRSFYLDAVIGPQLLSMLPGIPNPATPAYQATNISIYPIFTWTNPSTGGTPTSFNIYLDETDNPNTWIGNATGNIFMLNSPLQYNHFYSWKMTAINDAGEGVASTVYNFTTMSDPTINTFPWLVDFGTVAADWPVPGWTQLKGIFPNPSSTASQWSRDDWVNIANVNNNAARMNVFGTDRAGWLISPPIDIPSDDFELQFSLGLTDYTFPSPIEDPTSQLDDKFIVAMSDTRNMANPVILRQWNNAGSEYIYNQIPHTGLVSSIPLTGITGTKYFAFYGESTLPGGDNDLYVDNITVRQTPPGGHLAASPPEWDFPHVVINTSAEKTFIISNDGYAPLLVSQAMVSGPYFSGPETFVPITLGVGDTFEFTVIYAPLQGGNHSGAITFSGDRFTTVVNLSAYCHDPIVATFPWSQDFGTASEDWPVADWTIKSGIFPNFVYDFTLWGQDDWLNQPGGGSKAAKIICYYSNYCYGWLITPGINIPAANYWLAFDLGLTNLNQSAPIPFPLPSNDGRFIVAMSDSLNMTSSTILREWNNSGSEYVFNQIPHTGIRVNIPLDGITGVKYFAFYLGSTTNGSYQADLMIDNVEISNSVNITDPNTPAVATTKLMGNFPNPFNPETTIKYNLKAAGPITLDIYNLKGQLVRTLVHAHKTGGEHSAVWDGKDDSGVLVGSGIYFCRLTDTETAVSSKVILAK